MKTSDIALNAELKQAVLEFLNENFTPWTFGGNEPVVDAFVAKLSDVVAAYQVEPYGVREHRA